MSNSDESSYLILCKCQQLIEQFKDSESYHSTGHHKRLNRNNLHNISALGDGAYAIEELIAQLCASILCSQARIGYLTKQNQAPFRVEYPISA